MHRLLQLLKLQRDSPKTEDHGSRSTDQYWQIPHASNRQEMVMEMDGRNYVFSRTASLEQIRRAYINMQRQLLSYSKCTTEELKKFVEDRRLRNTDPTMPQEAEHLPRSEVILLLELADSECSFRRLKDFPVEIQTKVCEFYVAGLPEVLHMPEIPPLAKVDPDFATMTLPSFYDSKVFVLEYSALPYATSAMPPQGRAVYRLLPKYQKWLNELPESHLGRIRSLRTYQLALVSNSVNIRLQKSHPEGGHVEWGGRVTNQLVDDDPEGMLERLRGWLRGIQGINGEIKLTIGNIDAIRVALQGGTQG